MLVFNHSSLLLPSCWEANLSLSENMQTFQCLGTGGKIDPSICPCIFHTVCFMCLACSFSASLSLSLSFVSVCVCVYVNTHTHTHTHIYTYTYIILVYFKWN